MKTLRRSQLRRRRFRQGDEDRLVSLWNEAHASYSGFVPRTPPYWRWSILERPGVAPEDIIILEAHGEVVGFCVLWYRPTSNQGEAHGHVLEMGVDAGLGRRARCVVAARLIVEAERRGQEIGVDRLSFQFPGSDPEVRKAVLRAGYQEESSDSLQLVIVDLARLLGAILDRRSVMVSPGFSSLLLKIEPGQYRFCSHRRILIRFDPCFEVIPDPGEDCPADAVVETDMSALTDLVFRRISPAAALDAATVAPAGAVKTAEQLFRKFTLQSHWYIPIADAR